MKPSAVPDRFPEGGAAARPAIRRCSLSTPQLGFGPNARFEHAITQHTTSLPGESAAVLRSTVYSWLELDEEAGPAETAAVPLPRVEEGTEPAVSAAIAYSVLDGVFQTGLRHALSEQDDGVAQLEADVPRILASLLARS